MLDMLSSLLRNPALAGGSGDLGAMLQTFQAISSQGGLDLANTQAVMGIVAKYLKEGLQANQAANGFDQTQALVDQLGGTEPNAAAIEAFLNQPQVEQMLGEIEARTGLPAGSIEPILPMAVPLMLNFLKSNEQGNSLLSGYLDSDGDGDIDMSDLMGLAMKYLNR
ncbi:hypothetical protein H6G51_10460 [Limnothrix sp. FACHB-708]|uniref:hypothetical protein n=1 Tax=unclassified Limnothrix TaxID=2632864 RepID=UPI0016895C93|nr:MULTISPECIES: hypothetical protein [unclassified Limnothrix]MBD2553700.1 hypothetical protein [Limnothrix sp. FACHB-708]MBD2591171.1 hypothetical protein [Limnothrix sp. FACHB-406]